MGELCPVMTSPSGLSCLGALSRSFRLGPYVAPHRKSTLKVNKITRISYVVFLLIMLAGSCVASPRVVRVDNNVNAVYFKSRFCQPVPESELQRRMGALFDHKRMYPGKDANNKRSANDRDNEEDEEEEEEAESEFFEAEEDEVREGEILDYSVADRDNRDKHQYEMESTTHVPIYNFMRKKRELSEKRFADEADLHLQLLLNGKNKKARRQLKKKLRAKARKGKSFKKPLPWECKMKNEWLRTDEGVYPEFILTGRCETPKCFYRLYDCIPKKYSIKLLKRDPDQCNPLPTIGLNATYEERWFFIRDYTTVGCDCSRKQKSRRRGSN